MANVKDTEQTAEPKLLSDYFKDGAQWSGEELSADKLDVLLKPELLEKGKFYGKIIPVLDYFYIHTDGEVHLFKSRGDFQKAANVNDDWKEEKGRTNKRIEYRKAYRDMLIFEVGEFEDWLNGFSRDDNPNPFRLKSRPGEGKGTAPQTNFATSDLRNMTPEQRLEFAAKYNETLTNRIERGKSLGEGRKASREAEKEDTKSKTKGKK